MDFRLICSDCGAATADNTAAKLCLSCGGVFDIEYESVPRGLTLPLREPSKRITLGEVVTPVVEITSQRIKARCKQLFIKNESYSPTGSFKDRGSSVLLSAAREDGVRQFVEDTSGNAGSSMAAYATKAGIQPIIFAPESVSAGKLNQIKIYGAETHLVAGSRYQATVAAGEYAAKHDIPTVSHNYSPHFVEGMKSFIYELPPDLISQLDAIVFPVGNGSLLLGTWLGLNEMLHHGTLTKMPKLCAAQASNIAPICAAVNGTDYERLGATVAAGISVEQPLRLQQVVAAVRKSGGYAAAVSDDAILKAQSALAQSEGVYCEATSAVPFAAIKHALDYFDGMTVLVALTGSGLKDPVQ